MTATATEIAHCTPADVGISYTETTPAALKAILEQYFHHFAKPSEGGGNLMMGHPCIKCGEPLAGFLGSFRWGIQHGEGQCSCGWPARACHYISDADGVEVVSIRNLVLQYHPDMVRATEEATEEMR